MTIKFSVTIEAASEEEFARDLASLRNSMINQMTGSTELFVSGLGPFKSEKIKAIKEMRALTGLGLKEAKDVVDRLELGNQVRLQKGDPEKCHTMLKQLQNLGFSAFVRVS